MHLTMVKKRLASGKPCEKCEQAEAMLRDRGLWEHVDEVLWAIEDEPDSPGMKLGRELGVELAPFFVVRDGEEHEVYTSALRLVRDRFPGARGAARRAPRPAVPDDLEAVAAGLADAPPQQIVRWGLECLGADCGIAFSGAEDVVLVDMAARTELPFTTFCLDTGRLHPETYRFIDRVRKHYGIDIRLPSPDPAELEPFVREKGLFSFYEDGHRECCGIRKVAPLRRMLGELRGWISGQRKDQSPATRAEIPVVQEDEAFQGVAGPLLKLNPLAGWTSAQVWAYIREHDVPYNELHDRGFISIGCEPCTRPTNPGEHERAGRWWWEDETRRECGLHVAEPANIDGEGI